MSSLSGNQHWSLTTQEKKGYDKFENFRHAFSRATVTKIAAAQSQLSTKDPIPFLVSAYQQKPKPPPASSLPPYLLTVVQLQEKNGKWLPTTSLYRQMGGNIPEPPPSVEQWRWCTALAMSFIRRHPEHIDELKDVYVKGLEWTHPALLEQASSTLPPLNPYYDLDPELVKKGKWKESVENSMTLGGYQNFLPSQLQDSRAAYKAETEVMVQTLTQNLNSQAEKNVEVEMGMTEKDAKQLRMKIKAEHTRMEIGDIKRNKKFDMIENKRQPLLNVEYKRLAKLNEFSELKKRWESTCTLNEEMKRLKLEEKKKNERKPFDNRNQVVEYAVSKRNPLGASTKKHSGPSPLATAAKEKAQQLLRLKREMKKTPLTELEYALKNVDSSTQWNYAAAEQHANLKQALDNSQASVVSCVIEYENTIQNLKKVLISSVHKFKTSRVVALRQSSFDELTALLGHPQGGRKGYSDWRGKSITGLLTKTIELIESVVKWREAVLAAQGKLGARNEYGDLIDHGSPTPFMWNGVNVLLMIPRGLDFLMKSQELVKWYGNDFTFERNPFMLAVPLDERPDTPIKDTRMVVQNGEKVEQVSESLAKISNKQKAYMARCQKVFADGGSWWPAEGGKKVSNILMRRIRAAEKVLHLEEQNNQ